MTERAADDFDAIRDRLAELRKERESEHAPEPIPPQPSEPMSGAYLKPATCACSTPLICGYHKRCRVMS